MSASFYDLQKFAATGIASPERTHYDKMRALAMAGGKIETLTGVPPISFKSDGTPLIAWSILANMTQTGTPSPDNIIIPQEFGDLVTSGDHAGEYAIPITCAGTTHTIYLAEPLRKIGDYADTVSSSGVVTRRIAKVVFDGTETDTSTTSSGSRAYFRFYLQSNPSMPQNYTGFCTHFENVSVTSSTTDIGFMPSVPSRSAIYFRPEDVSKTSIDDFKQFLADQYTRGTPVCVWYVLAEPTTEQITATEIATVKGSNTLTVDTDLQPSSMTITYTR